MSRDLSVIGRALAAPARSNMLAVLMDGSTRPASELASMAGVSAATASEHLALLLDAGLISCAPRGRQRFYFLADAEVAEALERLGQVSPAAPQRTYTQRRAGRELVRARLCYDHLAGRLGVALADALAARGLVRSADFAVTALGAVRLTELGIDIAALRRGRRPVVRACPDWTERTPHLAGALGAAIAAHFLDQNWLTRRAGGRGLAITGPGKRALAETWGVDFSAVS